MPFAKGNIANPLGRRAEQPFADALRMEISAAGADHRKLREIARNLLRIATIDKGTEALPAIMAVADRLDGKPMQQNTLTVVKRDASDWSREELVTFLQDAKRQVEERELKVIEAKPVDATEEKS